MIYGKKWGVEMIEVFRQSCFNRYFELGAAQALKDKIVNPPIYLSVGSEWIPPLLKKSLNDCGIKRANIFGQHRCHSYYLTFTGEDEALALELCGSPNGCNKGYGGSASIGNIEGNIKLYPHDGLLGSQVPIAVGHSIAKPDELTICVLGDAAAEECYALSALGMAITKKCNILFICEDNDLSLLTTKKERRSWDIADVTRAMGLYTIKGKLDDSLWKIQSQLVDCIRRAKNGFPAFINLPIERHLWHAGWGRDGEVQYDYLSRFVEDLENIDPNIQDRGELVHIEEEEKEKADAIWRKMYSNS